MLWATPSFITVSTCFQDQFGEAKVCQSPKLSSIFEAKPKWQLAGSTLGGVGDPLGRPGRKKSRRKVKEKWEK